MSKKSSLRVNRQVACEYLEIGFTRLDKLVADGKLVAERAFRTGETEPSNNSSRKHLRFTLESLDTTKKWLREEERLKYEAQLKTEASPKTVKNEAPITGFPQVQGVLMGQSKKLKLLEDILAQHTDQLKALQVTLNTILEHLTK